MSEAALHASSRDDAVHAERSPITPADPADGPRRPGPRYPGPRYPGPRYPDPGYPDPGYPDPGTRATDNPAPERSVALTAGPPETVLPAEPAALSEGLALALKHSEADDRRTALATLVASNPTFLDGWAALSEEAARSGSIEGEVESYAYARVGYHRGLDSLRGSGWKGSGFVRWTHETNRGFLRSLSALRSTAAGIGESAEAQRCEAFLHQLDPDWDDATSAGLRSH